MSTFGGRVVEMDFVSIDRFDGANLQSSAFFLSHCHRDHMVGLDTSAFLARLESGYSLYCDSITTLLLLSDNTGKFTHLKEHMISLEMNKPRAISIKDKTGSDVHFQVTALAAQHCLGSVMFLFEYNSQHILYSGDIRLTGREIQRCAVLKNLLSNSAGLEAFQRHSDCSKVSWTLFTNPCIDSLYLDTTFCKPQTSRLPKRVDSVRHIVRLARDWLAEAGSHKVLLFLSSRYGHEFAIEQLSKQLKTKVHVSAWKAAIYSKVPTLAPCITQDKAARVHACAFWDSESDEPSCRPGTASSTCGAVAMSDPDTLVIKPCTLFFQQLVQQGRSKVPFVHSDRGRPNFHRVLYSMHSSREELRDIISYLRPRRLYANVVPEQDDEADILKELHSLVPELTFENGGTTGQGQVGSSFDSSSLGSPVRHGCGDATPPSTPQSSQNNSRPASSRSSIEQEQEESAAPLDAPRRTRTKCTPPRKRPIEYLLRRQEEANEAVKRSLRCDDQECESSSSNAAADLTGASQCDQIFGDWLNPVAGSVDADTAVVANNAATYEDVGRRLKTRERDLLDDLLGSDEDEVEDEERAATEDNSHDAPTPCNASSLPSESLPNDESSQPSNSLHVDEHDTTTPVDHVSSSREASANNDCIQDRTAGVTPRKTPRARKKLYGAGCGVPTGDWTWKNKAKLGQSLRPRK